MIITFPKQYYNFTNIFITYTLIARILRFSRYNDEWQTKKLGELAEIIGGGTPSTKNNEYWNGPINWFTPSEITSKYCYDSERTITEEGLNNSSAKMLPINSILITTRATIGLISINKEECSTNQGFQSLILKNQNCEFVYYMLHDYINEMKKLAIGSTFLEISKKDLKKIKVYIPSIDEQNNIACFLSNIDKKIELLRDRKEGFIEFKHYLLQNLFPQNGETVPKLRFNQFADELKSYTLKDLFNSKTGDGQFECILYGELFTTYDEIITTIKSKTDSGDGVLSEYGDILIPISTTTTGSDLVIASVILKDDVKLGSDMTILRKKKKDIIDEIYFAYYFTYILPKEISKYAQGITIVHLAWKYFKNTKITVPSLLEQKTVVNLLINIDNKIDLIEKEIEQLEEYKKGLLQKMFIWRVVLCLNVVSYSDFLKLLFVINYIKITN